MNLCWVWSRSIELVHGVYITLVRERKKTGKFDSHIDLAVFDEPGNSSGEKMEPLAKMRNFSFQKRGNGAIG